MYGWKEDSKRKSRLKLIGKIDGEGSRSQATPCRGKENDIGSIRMRLAWV